MKKHILARIEWKEPGALFGGVCFLVSEGISMQFVPECRIADGSCGYDQARVDAMFAAIAEDKAHQRAKELAEGNRADAGRRASGAGGGSFPCSISL